MPQQKPAEYSTAPSIQVRPPSGPPPCHNDQYHSQRRASSSRNNPPTSRTSQRHGTRSSSARGDYSNSPLPNNSYYQPASAARYGNALSPISEQVPERITSFLPPDAPLPSGQRPMTPKEAHDLCQELVRRIWVTNLGQMFDKVIDADRRGIIDDRFYAQLLNFFYCFIPMVTKSPAEDPIVIRESELINHKYIMDGFGELRQYRPGETGALPSHRWYSKPKDGLKGAVVDGVGGIMRMLKAKKGGAPKETII